MKPLNLKRFNDLVSYRPSILETAKVCFNRPSSEGPVTVLEHEGADGWLSQYRIDGRAVSAIIKALERKQQALANFEKNMRDRRVGLDVWTGR